MKQVKTKSQPATLKFYAKADLLVMEPNVWNVVGFPARYVGRKWDKDLRGYPATPAPYSCPVKSPEARRLIKITKRDHSLFPADEFTAQQCDVSFEEVEFEDGEWVLRSKED